MDIIKRFGNKISDLANRSGTFAFTLFFLYCAVVSVASTLFFCGIGYLLTH